MTMTPNRAEVPSRPTADEMLVRGIERDRVWPQLYWDEDVYAREMDLLYGSYWVYVGHDSEVPRPGNFVRRSVGGQELILTRDRRDQVRVLFNRCTHRGNLVCIDPCGEARALRCAYHGWTFGLDGALRAVPFPDGYRNIDQTKEELGLGRPAQTCDYRGFVFCQLQADPTAPSFEEFIAPAREPIDRISDLSPRGRIQLTAGYINHRYHSNWKMVLESLIDGYHGNFVHRSLQEIGLMGSPNRAESRVPSGSAVRHMGMGHTEIDSRPRWRSQEPMSWTGPPAPQKVANYVRALTEAQGEERARQTLLDGPPHMVIYPNVFIAEMNLMIIQPVSAEETNTLTTPILLEGGEEMNQRTVLNFAAMGPAGLIIADDGEVQERAQLALHTISPEWLDLSRGMDQEVLEEHGEASFDASAETAARGMWKQYQAIMLRRQPNRPAWAIR
jgi:phenylpropionate dioxygenase-like ring-hydroxylating dioxygenase large terminal subunit